MDNLLNEQSIKIFSSKLYTVLNYTLPGIFTLEIFFKKGLFSNTPQTIFEFILLLLWSFIFSIPFNIFDAFSIKNILKELMNEIKKKGLLNEEVEIEFRKVLKENKENHEEIDSMIQFFSINIYLIFTFLVYKYLVSHYIYTSFWGINKTIIVYLNTLLFYPICFVCIFWIGKIIGKKFAKGMLNEIHSD